MQMFPSLLLALAPLGHDPAPHAATSVAPRAADTALSYFEPAAALRGAAVTRRDDLDARTLFVVGVDDGGTPGDPSDDRWFERARIDPQAGSLSVTLAAAEVEAGLPVLLAPVNRALWVAQRPDAFVLTRRAAGGETPPRLVGAEELVFDWPAGFSDAILASPRWMAPELASPAPASTIELAAAAQNPPLAALAAFAGGIYLIELDASTGAPSRVSPLIAPAQPGPSAPPVPGSGPSPIAGPGAPAGPLGVAPGSPASLGPLGFLIQLRCLFAGIPIPNFAVGPPPFIAVCAAATAPPFAHPGCIPLLCPLLGGTCAPFILCVGVFFNGLWHVGAAPLCLCI